VNGKTPIREGRHTVSRYLVSVIRSVPVLLTAVVIVVSASFAQDAHLVSKGTWSDKPVSLEDMNRKIDDAAQEFKDIEAETARERQGVPLIPRVAFYDIAYPANAREYAELDGYALMLVTAVSHEKDELPVKRVSLSSGGKMISLEPVMSALSKQKTGSLAVKIFGPYRMDALYLLPVHLRANKAELLMDFAANRKGFSFGKFDGIVPESIAGLPIKPPKGKGPAKKALTKIIHREYPGFDVKE
jgi:hypothetical protein